MRVTAGILMIIGGFIGGSLWFGLSGQLVSHILQTFTTADPESTAVVLGFPLALIRFLPAFLAVIGGIYALKKKHWRWALVGAICSLLLPVTGIPAVILLIKCKGEF